MQDKLIIIYKGLQQRRSFKKFFGEDLKRNDFLDNLASKRGIDDLLREAIVELAEFTREDHDHSEDEYRDLFDYLVNREPVESICMRYGIQGPDEIKLDDVAEALSRFE
ncbi:hypothetical protein [Methanothermobacter sp.]|uniref:hypothetical protein n=1 Tax=Methanothermobacter sp. TaxID=1884223 RepID=UPI00260E8F34|nr:hypothetical protein [Methanothermobacter sp.]MDI9618939.1 hypothetical protein [Methanothermobacter sp.]